MTSQTYRLVMLSGPAQGRSYELIKDEISIGRDEANDIVINQIEISRKHARLSKQASGYVIEDLGSTNGTYINGTRLIGPHLLRPGETITLAEKVTLEFKSLSATDATLPITAAVPPEAHTIPPSGPSAQPEPVTKLPSAQPYSSPQPAQPPVVPPGESYAPSMQQISAETLPPSQPAPTGQQADVSYNDEAVTEEEEIAINWNWVFAGFGCVTILAFILLVAALFWIDAGGEARWCQFLGFLFPNYCP